MAAMKYFLMMVMTIAGVGGAPVFLVQPLILSPDIQLSMLQNTQVIPPSGAAQTLLVTPKRLNSEDGPIEEYDEGIEESRDWKEDESQTKQDYDTGDYVQGKQYEKPDDYNEKTHDEITTTENNNETGQYTENSEVEDESGKYDKQEQEYEGHEGSGQSGQYIENTTDESSESGQYVEQSTVESDQSGRYIEQPGEGSYDTENREGKSTDARDENVSFNNKQTNVKSDEQVVSLVFPIDKDARNIEEAQEMLSRNDDKSTVPVKAEPTGRITEEIVVGSLDKTRIQVQEVLAQLSTDTKQVLPLIELKPNVKETEEVQLSPVVYHVSPKLLQLTPVQFAVI